MSDTLPAKFAALADGPTNEGTRPGPPPRAYMLTRDEAERMMKAARAIVAAGPVMELPAGYTLIESTLITDLAAAIDDTNIGA